MGIALQMLLEHRRDAGFADARLAGQQNHPAFAGFDLLPTPEQQFDFFSPPDERRPAWAQRLEAALDCAFAKHLPDRHRLADALDVHRAEIAVFEEIAEELARAGTDDHHV